MVYKSLSRLVPTFLSNSFSRTSSRDAICLRNSETDLPVPLFKTAKWGGNHLHIVMFIFGTDFDLRLAKHSLYLYLNIDFDIFLFLCYIFVILAL